MGLTLNLRSGPDPQRDLKTKIMKELYGVLNRNLNERLEALDDQTETDIVFSCLIMFAREILVGMILSFGNLKYHQSILAQFELALATAVDESILKHTTNPTDETH